ncbi:putative immunity protein [Pseudonocardia nantongensis]|uniref:putative immunity protein n=1 Tax=Pseudonocardia nantongensis TaxID=1181885 RepID=UPI00397E787A
MDDLRVVARYAVQRAEAVLPLFEERHPEDRRPRAAIDAAWIFVDGTERSRLQRVTVLDAHRAAKGASTGAATDAAHAAGDAAARAAHEDAGHRAALVLSRDAGNRRHGQRTPGPVGPRSDGPAVPRPAVVPSLGAWPTAPRCPSAGCRT